MSKWQRLDLLTLERGLFTSRQKAVTAIMDGSVLVDGVKVTKPGKNISERSTVELIPSYSESQFVSRGGLKLAKALSAFSIDVKERICLDIGASTGGFTDCLLKAGALKVHAIDVGYGQLDWSLRSDARVFVKERCNARYLKAEEIYKAGEEKATFAAIDVSFISLKLILPPCVELLFAQRSELVCLVKPQFEAGREQVGKKGVVHSEDVHCHVLESVIETAQEAGFKSINLAYSPLLGPAGNIEFLLHLANDDQIANLLTLNVQEIVRSAHLELVQKEKG
jgi:23S rRNA (cytidine1920-2'-O)/16S rRNA (cytidine1409-2'-O)-methyltransferase